MKHNQQHFSLAKSLAKIFTVTLVTIVLTSCASSPRFDTGGLGRPRDAVPFMAAARRGTLPSGMRYYLLENSRPEGRVFMNLVVNAGSVLEEDSERGYAHFVEHMAFKGTARFPKTSLIDYLRSLGMRFGYELNASTSANETIYNFEVPVETASDGRKRIPVRALEIMDDWARAVSFLPEDVDSERPVILEEIRVYQGARQRISREITPVLYRGSRYAERETLGIPRVIEEATAESLKAFYEKWYRSDNMALVIVGDFDAALLEAELERHFPGTRNTTPPAASAAFSRPQFDLAPSERGRLETLILTDRELTQSRIDLYWKRSASPRRSDIAGYRELLIENIISTMLALRFQEDGEKSDAPFVWAGAVPRRFGPSSRWFFMASQAKTGSVTPTLAALLRAKESIIRHGFTEDEIQAAKAYLVSNAEEMFAEADRQHSNLFASAFNRHFLYGEAKPDIGWEVKAQKSLLPGINTREINRAAAALFSDDDLVVIITANESEAPHLPGDGEIRTLVREIRRERAAAPVRAARVGELLPREKIPPAGIIASERVDEETGAVLWRLANGAEIILKETTNRNNEISLYALARGGTFSAADAEAVSASLAAEMQAASGLGSFSRSGLTHLLLDKQVSLSFWTSAFLRGFQGSASTQDTETFFQMLYLYFTEPRLDDEAIAVMLDQMHSRMIHQENDPVFLFRREIARTVNGNPRYHPLAIADLGRADSADALAFLKRCLNIGDYTFVFTGNINLPRIRGLVETYLASIPKGGPSGAASLNEWAVTHPGRPAPLERDIHRGMEERSVVDLRWFMPLEYSPGVYAASRIINGYLDIVLNDLIRTSLGGVYSIGSFVSHSLVPSGELAATVTFVCDPGRAAELIEAVREEFTRISHGLNEEVYKKAVEALIKTHEESLESNFSIAQSYANSAVIYHSPLSRQNHLPALYRSQSERDVSAMAARLFATGMYRFVLYPEGFRASR